MYWKINVSFVINVWKYIVECLAKNKKINQGICAEFIYNHLVDATAGVLLFYECIDRLTISTFVSTWILIEMGIIIN